MNQNSPLSPPAFILAVIIFTLAILSASVMTPQSRYYRFQSLNNGITSKADWIYERLHFDPAPIDIALVGTSRTGGSLSAPLIEREYCLATGRRIDVANLAIPRMGRNMHFLIAREAMRTKSPALVVVELNEREARKPHPSFIYLAEPGDILGAPLLVNVNYFSDLLRLPGRQLKLFAQSTIGKGPIRPAFDPSAYPGAHLDRTSQYTLMDGRVISRDKFMGPDALDADLRQRDAGRTRPNILPAPLRALEYRLPRLYFEKIDQEAEKAGSMVDYVYIPGWRAGDFPADIAHNIGGRQPTYTPLAALTDQAAFWLDASHLNADGAHAASLRFAAQLAHEHPALGAPGGCDW